MPGILYIVPTPVGNLDDMTFRAVNVLREADLVLAEDTRTSSVLLKHFGIEARHLQSHHKFNEHQTVPIIRDRILSGQNVALISDAGTPGISDPGFLLVRECAAEGIEVQTLPGPTACIPAIVSSGLPCDRFCFEGFLPVKKGRQTLLKELSAETRTMIFYESPYRLVKTLDQMAQYFGPERECSVAREISKIHEEHRRGSLADVAQWFREHEPKGEIVLVVAGAPIRRRGGDGAGERHCIIRAGDQVNYDPEQRGRQVSVQIIHYRGGCPCVSYYRLSDSRLHSPCGDAEDIVLGAGHSLCGSSCLRSRGCSGA